MKYKKENEVCDHCKKEIKEVETMHGIAYDSFYYPHCKNENKRY